MRIRVDFRNVGHPLSWVVERLDVTDTFEWGYKALCPAHHDENASLSVKRYPDEAFKGEEGYGLKCHAGCTTREIWDALEFEGDKPAKVEIDHDGQQDDHLHLRPAVKIIEESKKVNLIDWWCEYTGVYDRSFWEHLGVSQSRYNGQEALTFKGQTGTRYRMGQEKKTPGGAHLWPRLPNTKIEEVWLCEGESDTGILQYLGFPAHTTGGAGTAHNNAELFDLFETWGVLRVRVCFDIDRTGRREGEKLVQKLILEGYDAVRIDLTELRGDFREKDIRDLWLRLGRMLGGELRRLETVALEGVDDENAIDFAKRAEGEIPWIVEDFLLEGGFTLLIAPPKKAKSTFNFTLASAMGRALKLDGGGGVEFLGRNVRGGNIAFMTEDSPWPWRSKMEAHMRDGEGAHVAVMTHADWIGHSWEEKFATAIRRAKRKRARLLIIDTIMTWANIKDENDSPTIYAALELVRTTAARERICVLGVHYHTKDGAARGARGSGAWEAIPDIVLSVEVKGEGDSERRVLTARTKIGFPCEPVVYQLDRETGRLLRDVGVRVTLVSSDGGKLKDASRVDFEDVCGDILRWVTGNAGASEGVWCDVAEIADGTGYLAMHHTNGYRVFMSCLNELVKADALEKITRDKKNLYRRKDG